MRFAVKSTVTLIVLYLVGLGGLVVWMEYELRSVAGSLMEETARLVSSEIAATMSEAALAHLQQPEPATRQRLEQIVADLTKRSDVVASIAVVDDTGRVVVSDELPIGHQLTPSALVFQGTTRPLFLSAPAPLKGGTYHLFMPLLRQESLVGYIRVSLGSHRLAGLYRRAWRQVAVAALIGLSGIAALGFLLHTQLARRGAALARTLEATARGEPLPGHALRDEFSQALEAAGRLGRELSDTRERSSQAQRRVSALANFMDVGVLLLAADRRLEFANAAARSLLGSENAGDLEQRWNSLTPLLDDVLDRTAQSPTGSARADLIVPVNAGSRHLRFELHRPEDDEHGGYLVLVKDRELLDAFETDLRLASQMRGLARVYGALAHELKAPLGAMALNLEMLNDALQTDEGDPAVRDRQQRYAEVLRDELARLNRSLVSVLSQTTSISDTQEPFDLRELIRDLEALLAPQAKQQRVALDVQLPGQEVRLVGHRDRLKQALLNIASNGLEAMPQGGRMDVALDRCNGSAMITIRDSGTGIAPELLGNIFSMYFTTKTGGSGIGLYVARSVVESHDGSIQVDSTRGKGTCFSITLPLTSTET